MTLNIALTGASGFCGSSILGKCHNAKHNVYCLNRKIKHNQQDNFIYFDLSCAKDLDPEDLNNIDVVIHTAALAHNKSKNSADIFRLNEEATKILFDKCIEAGVKKFVFLSTIGVYGKHSSNRVISVNDREQPASIYAQSKYNAENYLLDRNKSGAIELSILRLPLVYGTNAPGNFGFLAKIAKASLPLPFASTENKRSMIAVDTLANLVLKVCEGTLEARGIEIIADSISYSSKDLIESIRSRNSEPKRTFYFPKSIMKFALTAIGMSKIYEQLYEDLEFESTIDVNAAECVDVNTSPADYA